MPSRPRVGFRVSTTLRVRNVSAVKFIARHLEEVLGPALAHSSVSVPQQVSSDLAEAPLIVEQIDRWVALTREHHVELRPKGHRCEASIAGESESTTGTILAGFRGAAPPKKILT